MPFNAFVISLFLMFSAPEQNDDQGNTFTIRGEYRYVDGDTIFWPCSPSDTCVDALIRDERLSGEASRLLGSILVLRVERVDACGDRSNPMVCLRNSNGSALKILGWIAVESSPPPTVELR
jgi:hypothetical protein